MKFHYPKGATPLNADEQEALIPTHIVTQKQLNEWEAQNITEAEKWLWFTNHKGNFLQTDFAKRLHEKMFDKTWQWAGQFRKTERNIGVVPYKIHSELKTLFDDVTFQIVNDTYPSDEIAYRFHHRLVSIHPFPNGNGRHVRLLCNFLLSELGELPFSFGKENLENESETRDQYIAALKAADKHDYKLLKAFVRT